MNKYRILTIFIFFLIFFGSLFFNKLFVRSAMAACCGSGCCIFERVICPEDEYGNPCNPLVDPNCYCVYEEIRRDCFSCFWLEGKCGVCEACGTGETRCEENCWVSPSCSCENTLNCGQTCAANGCDACACDSDYQNPAYSWSSLGCSSDCSTCFCGTHIGGTGTPAPTPTDTPAPTPTDTPAPTPTDTPAPPTCTVSLAPGSLSLDVGESDLITANVTVQNGSVNRVDFSSSDSGVASIDPTSDSGSPYRTQVTGRSVGSAQVNASVSLNPSGSCSTGTPANISVEAAGWFQTQGGTIHAEGNLSNEIPSTAVDRNLSIAADGFPGVISHQSTTEANFGEGYPSSDDANHWLAKSSYQGKNFGSWTFFEKKYAVEMQTEDFTGTLPHQDGIYYSSSGKTLQGNWNVPANRWLLVLVDGDITVPSNISVSNGSFLGIVSSGDINFENTTSQVEGMFIAGSTINTGDTNTQFQAEGFFAASQFILGRDLEGSNPTTPAELFTFRPDFLINSYKDADYNLWWFDFKWEEIAP